jgi:hypothetical protein
VQDTSAHIGGTNEFADPDPSGNFVPGDPVSLGESRNALLFQVTRVKLVDLPVHAADRARERVAFAAAEKRAQAEDNKAKGDDKRGEHKK